MATPTGCKYKGLNKFECGKTQFYYFSTFAELIIGVKTFEQNFRFHELI